MRFFRELAQNHSGSSSVTALTITIFFCTVFIWLPVHAAVDEKPAMAEEVASEVSKRIDQTATSIDLYLSGKKRSEVPNKSKAEITQNVTLREGGRLDNSTDFNLDVRLPNLEKRWQARFSSYDEADEDRDLQQKAVRTRPREKRPGAALRFLEDVGNVRTSFQPRLIVKDPLVLNYILRFESAVEQKNKFRLSPKLELFADAEKGTGEYASLELSIDVAENYGASVRAEEEYSAFESKFTTGQGADIRRRLSDIQSIGIGISFFSTSKPEYHLESYTVVTSYAHAIKPRRLEASLALFLDFQKASAFKGATGSTLSINLIF